MAEFEIAISAIVLVLLISNCLAFYLITSLRSDVLYLKEIVIRPRIIPDLPQDGEAVPLPYLKPQAAYPKPPEKKAPIYVDDETAYRIELKNKQNNPPML